MILIAILLFSIIFFKIIGQNSEIRNIVLKSILSLNLTVTILSFCYLIVLAFRINFKLFELLFLFIPLTYLIVCYTKNKKIDFSFKVIKNQSFFILFIILILLTVFSYNYFDSSIRWGEWDAWAIWSSHAKVLTSETYFTNLFTDKISWTHPDYPLFLPANIAVIWKSIGVHSAFVPAIFAYINALALVLIILTSFIEKKQTIIGILLISSITYFDVLFPFVTSQYADTILALFFLIPFILLEHLPNENPLKTLVLIGFFSASSAWIKNEGIMFFVIFGLVFFIKYRSNYKFLLYFVLGAFLPLLVLVFFKMNYAPTNDLMNSTLNQYLEKLKNVENYRIILDFGYSFITTNCKFLYISLIAMLFINYKYFYSFTFVIILGLLSAYFFVYVTTPNDITWHLTTSFDRLIHQVTPILLYSIYITLAKKLQKSNVIIDIKKNRWV